MIVFRIFIILMFLFAYHNNIFICAADKTTSHFTTKYAKECEKQIEHQQKNGHLPWIEKVEDLETTEDTCEIFLCRHGKTESNSQQIVQGRRINDHLLPDEHQKCKSYAEWLIEKGFDFEIFYTSELARSRETLDGILSVKNKSVAFETNIDTDLTDVDYGIFEGMKIAKVIENDDFNNMYLNINSSAPRGKDTYHKTIVRMYKALNGYAIKHSGKKILVVSSQYPINFMFSLINRGFYKKIENFSKIKIRWKRGICCGDHIDINNAFSVYGCKKCVPALVKII